MFRSKVEKIRDKINRLGKDKSKLNETLDKADDVLETSSEFDIDFDKEFGSKREPSKVKLAKEFAQTTQTEFVKKLTDKLSDQLIPEEYKTGYSELKNTFSTFKYELDTGLDSIKRETVPLFKMLNKVLPKRIEYFDKLADRFSPNVVRERTKEEIQNEQIKNVLTSIFERQESVAQIKDTKDDVTKTAQLSISKLNQETLTSIDNSINDIKNFTVNISKEYYRKSLELQLRSYFIQKEQLEEFKKFTMASVSQFDSIVKNTGLPEVVKISRMERIEDITKDKIMQGIHNKLFGKGSYFDMVRERLTGNIKEKLSGIRSNLSTASSMSSMVSGLSDNQELGGKSSFISSFLASVLGDKIADALSKRLGASNIADIKSSPVVESGRLGISGFLSSPGLYVNRLRDYFSKKEADVSGDTSVGSFFKKKLFGLGRGVADILSPEPLATPTTIRESLSSLTSPAIFDRKVYKSITEIIPLYLSKILHENTTLTEAYITSNKQTLSQFERPVQKVYNPITRKLTTQSELLTNVQSDITGQGQDYTQSLLLNMFTTNLQNPIIKSNKKSNEFSKQVENKKTLDELSAYTKMALSKGIKVKTFEDLVKFSQTDPDARSKLSSLYNLKKLFNSYSELEDQSKEQIDVAYTKAKETAEVDYPVVPVTMLLEFLTRYVKPYPVFPKEGIKAIAKALSHFIFQKRTDLTPDDIISLSAFTKVQKDDFERVKDIVVYMSKAVDEVLKKGGYKEKTALYFYLSVINKAVREKVVIPDNAFQIAKEFNPELEPYKAANVFEKNFVSNITTEYVDPSRLYSGLKDQNEDILFTQPKSSFKDDLKDLGKKVKDTTKQTAKTVKEDITKFSITTKARVTAFYSKVSKQLTGIKNDFNEYYTTIKETEDSDIDALVTTTGYLFSKVSSKVDEVKESLTTAHQEQINYISSKVSSVKQSEYITNITNKSKEAQVKLDVFKKAVDSIRTKMTYRLKEAPDIVTKRKVIFESLTELKTTVYNLTQ